MSAGAFVYVLVALGLASPARADERWLLDAELDVGLPLTDPQRDLFGVGGTLSLGVLRTLAPWAALGARLRTGLFLEGDPVTAPGVADPGLGTLNMAEGALRFRIPDGTDRRGTGLWIEGNAGGGFTGDLLRASFGGALGWGFRVGDGYALGPHVRYLQIVEPKGGLDARDARILLAGLSFTALDAKDPEVPPPPPPPPDRDGDGVVDAEDACPDEAEDHDGFQDADGCPEQDNDQDGILDEDDACPDVAEDEDGFEDADGCPEEDNDGDGILDSLDQCPLERETVNGVDDRDGCPDEGLIVMHEDRIVLEERVLFDLNRARVRSRGRPMLRAIVHLASQHPEWKRVRIEGHADEQGNADFNQRLSVRRAHAVRHELVKLGMDPSLLVSEGFGATRPRAEGHTDEAHRKNRRVEFVVIEEVAEEVPAGEAVDESGEATTPREVNDLAAEDEEPEVDVEGDTEAGVEAGEGAP